MNGEPGGKLTEINSGDVITWSNGQPAGFGYYAGKPDPDTAMKSGEATSPYTVEAVSGAISFSISTIIS